MQYGVNGLYIRDYLSIKMHNREDFMSLDPHISVSCPADKSLCVDADPAPLLRALDDLGIATIGTCEDTESGFVGIEFPTADDAEEFLTLLMVTLNSRKVYDPEMDEWLTSRMLGTGCSHNGDPIWTYQAYPLDPQSYLDPEIPRIESSLPFAVSLKIAIRLPAEDYPRVLELITKCSKLSSYCR